jgi:hypothetical protein
MPVFELQAQVIDRASYGLGLAPKRISRAIMRRFYIERNRFVGKRKKSTGTFTRSVLAMSRRTRSGKLPIQVAGMFRGVVKEQLKTGSMNILSLRMGILKDNPTQFMRGIIEMQEGYSHSSSGFMPVPIYKNLAKIGVTYNFFKRFKEMMSAGEIESIKMGGQILFVSKKLREEYGDVYDAALFVGTRRVNVRPMNFRFIDKWRAAWPGFQKRLGNAIEREIRAVEKGYAKAE